MFKKKSLIAMAAAAAMPLAANAGTMTAVFNIPGGCYSAAGDVATIEIEITNIDVDTTTLLDHEVTVRTHPGVNYQYEQDYEDIACTLPVMGTTGSCTLNHTVRSVEVAAAGGETINLYLDLTWTEADGSDHQFWTVNPGSSQPQPLWGEVHQCAVTNTGGGGSGSGGSGSGGNNSTPVIWDGSPGMCTGMTTTDRGLTWTVMRHDPTTGVITMGSTTTNDGTESNPYCGDTVCSTPLPLLCTQKTNAAMPSGASSAYWIGGDVSATAPIAGNDPALANQAAADAYCAAEFGAGWEMAEHHDSPRGWYIQALQDRGIDQNNTQQRYWAAIRDQSRGNCWN